MNLRASFILLIFGLFSTYAGAAANSPAPKNIVNLIDCTVNGKSMTVTSAGMPDVYLEATVGTKKYQIVGTDQRWLNLIIDEYTIEIPFASADLPFFLNIQKSGFQLLCSYK